MQDYILTIKIAPKGTSLSDGTVSKAGHMWYEIYNPRTGITSSRGWGKGEDTTPGQENLRYNDSTYYIPDENHPITSISTSISEEEYNRLNSYPARAGAGLAPGFHTFYEVFSNSCIDFVAVALADAGLADQDFQGIPFSYPQDVANIQAFLVQLSRHHNQPIEIKNLPASIFDPNANGYTSETILPVNYILNKIKDPLESGDLLKKLPPFLKNPRMWLNFATGNWTGLLREMFFHQIDPLALDLNGNGIETLAANGHDGALFDHERLGIRTATGWIHSNDGILVYDRNGDGKINDGGEIFGDNTLLKNGKTAAHGFEAAADLDDNGDGKLDAADSAFGKLGVWRDLNHNGISEEGEIFALKDLRIKSLNLGYTQADKDLGNGNTLAEVGSYTDEDGNEHIMGDLRLSADRLHSRYSNSIPLTDEQQQEANLRGSGRLRDLREAAARSSELAEVLQQYKNAATKEEQLALRDKLLKAWADTDPQRVEDFFASALMTQSEGRKAIGLTPSQVKHMGEITVMDFGDFIGPPPDLGRQKRAELKRRIAILNAFTGTRSPNLYYFNEA